MSGLVTKVTKSQPPPMDANRSKSNSISADWQSLIRSLLKKREADRPHIGHVLRNADGIESRFLGTWINKWTAHVRESFPDAHGPKEKEEAHQLGQEQQQEESEEARRADATEPVAEHTVHTLHVDGTIGSEVPVTVIGDASADTERSEINTPNVSVVTENLTTNTETSKADEKNEHVDLQANKQDSWLGVGVTDARTHADASDVAHRRPTFEDQSSMDASHGSEGDEHRHPNEQTTLARQSSRREAWCQGNGGVGSKSVRAEDVQHDDDIVSSGCGGLVRHTDSKVSETSVENGEMSVKSEHDSDAGRGVKAGSSRRRSTNLETISGDVHHDRSIEPAVGRATAPTAAVGIDPHRTGDIPHSRRVQDENVERENAPSSKQSAAWQSHSRTREYGVNDNNKMTQYADVIPSQAATPLDMQMKEKTDEAARLKRENNKLRRVMTLAHKLYARQRFTELGNVLSTYQVSGAAVGTAETAAHSIRIGDRVVVGRARRLDGVIKYYGPTAFAPGDWVGIELDSDEGKNSGEVNGIRYYHCRRGHGVFVKADMLVPETSQ